MQLQKPYIQSYDALRASALAKDRVAGLTHRFYKYPARFSPRFVAAAIEAFSKPGDVVLDPYMGGGTSVLEAYARGRRSVGCDVNSLAVFVAKVKSTCLSEEELDEVTWWINDVVPRLSYRDSNADAGDQICPIRTYNLNVPRARPIKKLLALALHAVGQLTTTNGQDFARCILLNTGQWALNGRKSTPSLGAFRSQVTIAAQEMTDGMRSLKSAPFTANTTAPVLIHDSAENLLSHSFFRDSGNLADMVVTSPPYPGVHILYHRWQVDGRRESPAPYWIANRLDGEGASFYNFGGRAQAGLGDYFASSLSTLKATRSAMRKGAHMVQMIAFSDASVQLPRYLANMSDAGFEEITDQDDLPLRTWRDVPSRNWHASLNGRTSSSREVVLVHVAA
jgi:hypothetical protein